MMYDPNNPNEVGPSSVTLGPQTATNSAVSPTFSGLSSVNPTTAPIAPITGWGSLGTWSKPHGTW